LAVGDILDKGPRFVQSEAFVANLASHRIRLMGLFGEQSLIR
jgi:hypothetical protein